MKIRYLLLASVFSFVGAMPLKAQLIKLPKSVKDLTHKSGDKPTETEASQALKEALNKGVDKAVKGLARPDGFLGSDVYKILLPPQAEKMESTLRKMGMGSEVDKMVATMNHGAEQAVGEAKQVFINSIKQMTVQDALGIVTGGNGSATEYLKRTSQDSLRARFKPIVQEALNKTGATRNWADLARAYNKVPFTQPVETDLNAYVTGKALEAIFDEVRKQEDEIRQDPAARTSQLLQKVFGYAAGNK